MHHPVIVPLFAIVLVSTTAVRGAELEFRGQELPTRLTVGYAVRLIDMNDDQRLDIAIVDSKRVLWLENPNWNEHVMWEPPDQMHDNVCFAPADIDGDGRLDFALGADWQFNNTASGGTIGWLTRGAQGHTWRYHPIGQEPTVHRMEFADLQGDGRLELVVAPLKGRNTTPPDFAERGVRLLAYEIPKIPADPAAWEPRVINERLHVVHNFCPVERKQGAALLVASFEGVTWLERRPDGTWSSLRVGAGEQESPPNRGASEVKLGRLESGRYLATIEPWHGNQVVVYTEPGGSPPEDGATEWLWNRHVLDKQLKWGHAVWCANLDADADEELIIGVRDDASPTDLRGVRIYDPHSAPAGEWQRHMIDPGSVAVEDLAAGDLNGDGRVDVVAVGRQTHNVKIYWNETR